MPVMPAIFWLIALPVAATPLVYLLRKSWLGAAVAALVAFFLAWFALQLPADTILNLLGRTIVLDQLSQIVLALLFAATAILFLTLALFFVSDHSRQQIVLHTKRVGQEVRVFYPAALVILGLFVAASLSKHLGITAIFIELAAILAVFVIQTERLESTRAALRFLVLMSLAMPFFLLAAWFIDAVQPGNASTVAANVEQIALFVGLGFAVWLAVVPFHGWLTGTAAESSPPMAAFVLIAFPAVAFSVLIHLLVDLPWLSGSLYLVDAMLLAGVFTAFAGGVMASVQRGFSELLGYAVLYDLGCILAVLGLGGQAAVTTILVYLVVRTLALLLIAASTSTLHLSAAGDGFSQIRGVARRMPVAAAGLAIGGLTLAGVPLTAGFAPHWQLLRSMAQMDNRWLVLLVFGGLGVAIGYLRGLRAMLAPSHPSSEAFESQEPIPLLILIFALGLICILLGLFPAFLIEPLQAITINIPLPIN